ncbi:MAG: rRNA maturation RNase YbeY [Desulfomonilaceae bacterium]
MELYVESKQKRIEIDPEELQKKTVKILGDLGCEPDSIISITLVDSIKMAELNLKYRGKEGPTNVLSFSQLEGVTPPRKNLLGDVVICADRAADDAAELGYTEDQMVLYLLIHGILHLLGHTHDVSEDARDMSARVEEIFRGFYPEYETA